MPFPSLERFMQMVAVDPSGCWIWRGPTTPYRYGKGPAGYGKITYKVNNKTTNRMAHRVAYELMVGPIPAGMEIDHFACNNPSCVNPAHLKPVTHLENMRRAVATGRWQPRCGSHA